ncbi:MAG: DUF1320 family protein [Kiritimatiellae bacterium]|nr:DUF1320 family protein [Kiritimatiellia bacterium]
MAESRYCTDADLRALVPDLYRDAALADSFGGANADPGLLDIVLASACDEVDALISGRVRLPLPADAIPSKLRTAAALFAAETLCIRRGASLPEALAEKVKWWRDWLSKVGEGDLRLAAANESDDEAGKASAYAPAAIVARPALTGSHGLLGLIAVILGLSAAFIGTESDALAAVGHRTFSLAAPPDPATFSATPSIEWERGESLDLNLSGATLAPGQFPSWQVADASNLWMDVASSTLSFHAAPDTAALPPGRYMGRVVVTNADSSLVRVLAIQNVRVLPGAPDLCPPEPASTLATTDWVEGLATALSNALHQADAALDSRINSRINSLYGEMKGGWKYPDYFLAETPLAGVLPGTVTNTFTGTQSIYNVLVSTGAVERLKGWEIPARVIRQQDFEAEIAWRIVGGDGIDPESLEIRDNIVSFVDGTSAPSDGASARVSGSLGGYSVEVSLEYDASKQAATSTVYRFEGAAPGSLLASCWSNVIGTATNAYAQGKNIALRTWPEGIGNATNHVTAGWNPNFWAKDLGDFSCISYHTDGRPGGSGGAYRPVTMVTPRHGIVADHFKPMVGSNVYFVGQSGTILTNQIVEYKNVGGDLTVARMAAPMPTNEVAPATLLATGWHGYLYGSTNALGNIFGVPVIGFNFIEQGHLMNWEPLALRFGKTAATSRDDGAFILEPFHGHGFPYGRSQAVGGDSGSPVFWPVDGQTVLLGCFHTACGGPIPYKEEIDRTISETWGDEERTTEYDLKLGGWTNPDIPPVPN